MAAIHPHDAMHPAFGAMPGLATLTHFAAGFFTLALLCDVFYSQTALLMWQDFSSWLLFFGLIAGGIAALLWLVGFATDRLRPVWGAVILQVMVLVCALINSLIHAGDGWTAVVPWGIAMSALTCLLMLVAALLNRRAAHRPLQRA